MPTQDLIVAAYLRLLSQRPTEEISVTDLCDEAGVHRTTFYRYFEGVEDLDARFLSLVRGSPPAPDLPRSTEELAVVYESFVILMNQHREFFRHLWSHAHLQRYRAGWTTLVADSILVMFRRVVPAGFQEAWALHHRFAAGVIATYLEEAMADPPGHPLRTLTFYCMEFLHGGYLRFYQVTRPGSTLGADPGFDETLARYALHVDNLEAPVRPPSSHPRRRASDFAQEPPVQGAS